MPHSEGAEACMQVLENDPSTIGLPFYMSPLGLVEPFMRDILSILQSALAPDANQ